MGVEPPEAYLKQAESRAANDGTINVSFFSPTSSKQ
mgnify:CR=1 FL=1